MFALRSQETRWEGGMFSPGKRRMEQTFMGPRPQPEGKGPVSLSPQNIRQQQQGSLQGRQTCSRQNYESCLRTEQAAQLLGYSGDYMCSGKDQGFTGCVCPLACPGILPQLHSQHITRARCWCPVMTVYWENRSEEEMASQLSRSLATGTRGISPDLSHSPWAHSTPWALAS